MISQDEYNVLVKRCRQLPPAKGYYIIDNFIENIFCTVLDFRMKSKTLEKAGDFYRQNRAKEIYTFETLTSTVNRYSDNKEGNLDLARYLWGNNHWTRASLLRKLLDFLESNNIKNQQQLKAWAITSNYENDFKGKIPGMAFAIYKWLIMRQGVETVKPDINIKRFIKASLPQSDLNEIEIVSVLENVARDIGLKAYELDWKIWEYQRGKPGAT